jgi:hypothetical protein
MSTSAIEKRVSTMLSSRDATSDDLASLIAETETAIAAADEAAEAERKKALDPVLSPDPKAAREAIEAAELAREPFAHAAAATAGGAGGGVRRAVGV